MEIDMNLYSRQIGTYGLETMEKIITLNIFIYGMRGLGVEIAKNIILAGPKRVTIYDNSIVTYSDLGSNYFLNQIHVGQSTRADASLSKLRQLNPYVSINVFKGELAHNFSILKEYKIVIISELINLETAESVNQYCRDNKIGFVYCACLGLSGFSFTDFGDDFLIMDENGEDPKQYFIRNITNQNPGIVIIDDSVDNQKLELSSGDYVTFKEVAGMTELNESPPRPIIVLSPITFSMEDTSKFTEYLGSGIVEQVKVPKPAFFKSLKECKDRIYNEAPVDNDNFLEEGESIEELHSIPIDMTKGPLRNELLHLAILSVHEFFSKKNRLPYLNFTEDCIECVELSKMIHQVSIEKNINWAKKLTAIDEKIIFNVARWSRAHISPVCSFLGGVIAQEIVKITGKYTPLSQWLWFDFLEAITDGDVSMNCENIDRTFDKKSRFQEQVAIFGNALQKRLSELNIFIIGCGALGNEFLKLLTLMGLSQGTGTITIADNDLIEISNLNRQFLFKQSDVGQSKAIRCKEIILEINEYINCNSLQFKISEENDSLLDDEFWMKQDIIITAVDNIESRQYIDKKCTWFHKILIDLGTLVTKAHSQIIVPYMTSSYNDDNDFEQGIAICTVHNFPVSIEHCIEWARELFNTYFSADAKELNYLVKSDNLKTSFDFLANDLTCYQTQKKIRNYKALIQIAIAKDFKKVVEYVVNKFLENYDYMIRQLLINYPVDYTYDDGTKFWSGAKRTPTPIPLDLKDPMHLLFISSYAIILAKCLNVPSIDDYLAIKEIAQSCPGEDFQPRPKEEIICDDLQTLAQEFFAFVNMNKSNLTSDFLEIEFEKDTDSNHHIEFIMSSANIRAQNYKIKGCDFLKAKLVAGRIIPTVASISSSVSGIASLQVYSLARMNFDFSSSNYSKRESSILHNLRNSFINLGINLILLTNVFPVKLKTNIMKGSKIYKRAIPSEWSCWDKIEVEGSMTLRQFIEYFLQSYGVNVTKLIFLKTMTITGSLTEDNLDSTVEGFYLQEKVDSAKCRYLPLEIIGETITGEEALLPKIKYSF